jgi:hypothetical protein
MPMSEHYFAFSVILKRINEVDRNPIPWIFLSYDNNNKMGYSDTEVSYLPKHYYLGLPTQCSNILFGWWGRQIQVKKTIDTVY